MFYIAMAGVIASALLAAPTRGADSLGPELFDSDLSELSSKGWAARGECAIVEAKGLADAKRCLAIDGCGYVESPRIAVQPGKAYRISGWGRTEDDIQNNSCLKIKWYNDKDEVVYWEFVRRNNFTNDWRKYEKLAVVPHGASRVSLVCHAQATWGKCSHFTAVSLEPVDPPPLRLDMRFDRIREEWFNDRSPYANDGEAFCLKNEDIISSQDGAAANFQNRKAKVRFYHSQSLAVTSDEWVMVVQFCPEEPPTEAPEIAQFTILDSEDYYLQYRKEKNNNGKTVFNLVWLFRGLDENDRSVYSFVTMPIELFKWYRLTIRVDKKAMRFSTDLLIDGGKSVTQEARINVPIPTRCPIMYVGCKDYPREAGQPWPWGIWGQIDYIKIYSSFAAYQKDKPNLRYGGFGQ